MAKTMGTVKGTVNTFIRKVIKSTFIERRQRKISYRRGENYVTIEAEIGVTQPQNKEC